MSKPKKTPPKFQIGAKVQVLKNVDHRVGDVGHVTEIRESSSYGHLYFLDGVYNGVPWPEAELKFFEDRCDCDHTRPFVPACLDCVLKRWP
jgi:hypothetical protein